MSIPCLIVSHWSDTWLQTGSLQLCTADVYRVDLVKCSDKCRIFLKIPISVLFYRLSLKKINLLQIIPCSILLDLCEFRLLNNTIIAPYLGPSLCVETPIPIVLYTNSVMLSVLIFVAFHIIDTFMLFHFTWNLTQDFSIWVKKIFLT